MIITTVDKMIMFQLGSQVLKDSRKRQILGAERLDQKVGDENIILLQFVQG